MKHHDKYKHLDTTQRLQKVEELKRSLVSQQAMFTKAKSQSEAAVKASFIVAAEIAKSSRPFTEGEFVKNCMIKVCDTVCPEKKASIFKCEPEPKHRCWPCSSPCCQFPTACGKGKSFHRVLPCCGWEHRHFWYCPAVNFHPWGGLKPVRNRRVFWITLNAWHNYGERSLWRGVQMCR